MARMDDVRLLVRLSSAAFALSSGTIGAALSACLSAKPFPEPGSDERRTRSRTSSIRAIAVSYATVIYPTPPELFQPAHELACKIVNRLWADWDSNAPSASDAERGVDLFNVNIPVIWKLIGKNGPQDDAPSQSELEPMDVVWTKLWQNSYGSLFRSYTLQPPPPAGGPDATATTGSAAKKDSTPNLDEYKPTKEQIESLKPTGLSFRFAPNFKSIMNPGQDVVPVGTDAWALSRGWASVTPLHASFAEPRSDPPSLVGDDEAETVHQKAGETLKFKL